MVLIERPDVGGVRPVISDQRIRSAHSEWPVVSNGSIHGGSLFKPHGRLKLTLLTISINIAIF